MVFEQALAEAARGTSTKLLVLFGSRARHEVHAHSDWDFGYLGEDRFDEDVLRARLMEILGTDRIDLVGLSRASALLRFQVAAEGKCVFESTPGGYQSFQIEAATFWCDVEPVLRHAYAQILEKVRAA
jgi:predicted nucleotidyltransferase